MTEIKLFFLLVLYTLEGVSYGWVVGLPLMFLTFLAIILKNPFNQQMSSSRRFLLLTPFLITFLILLIGTVFAHRNSHTEAPKWPVYLLLGVASMHIPLGIYLVWKNKDYRWSIVAINLLQIYISICSLFIAGMSVTGDWL